VKGGVEIGKGKMEIGVGGWKVRSWVRGWVSFVGVGLVWAMCHLNPHPPKAEAAPKKL
jgi:hypothetical protein